MAELNLKNIPSDLKFDLKKRALEQGKTLRDFVLEVLAASVSKTSKGIQ